MEFRAKVPNGTATAKAMDYSLNRWGALTRYLDHPALPIDNNFDEQQIRPWATGRKNRWAAAGLMDTLLRWKIEPEVVYGNEAALCPGVQG